MAEETSVTKIRKHLRYLLRQPVFLALVIALAIYLTIVVITVIWLALNADTTVQRRIALSPSITVDIIRPKTEKTVPDDALGAVPSSWKNPEEALVDITATPDAGQNTIEQDQPAAAETPVAPAAAPADTINPATDTKWQTRARAFNHADTRPRVGLIVINLGLSQNTTRAAINTLPADVTLAFPAVTPNVTDWIIQSHSVGHENIVMIPMEPYRYPQNDPGPQTLLTSLDKTDNGRRLEWALDRSTHIVGAMPSQGERFMRSERVLAPVLDAIKQQGLLFIDALPGDKSAAPALAQLARLPLLQNTVTLDATASRQSIEQALTELENKAKQDGQAIALVLPYPATFERLSAWIKTLPEKNLLLAPVSDIMMQKNKAAAAAQPVTPATAAPAAPAAATKITPVAPDTAIAPNNTAPESPAPTSGSSPLLNPNADKLTTTIDHSLTISPVP